MSSHQISVYNINHMAQDYEKAKRFEDIIRLVERGESLPEGSKDWELCNKDGLTVAHIAAHYGRLPKNFDKWELADRSGRTVAHVAAESGHLPPDFDRWDLKDKYGWTVAHAAARWHHLPSDFDQWDLTDNNGRTVAHVIYESGKLPNDFNYYGLINDGPRKLFMLDDGLYANINSVRGLELDLNSDDLYHISNIYI